MCLLIFQKMHWPLLSFILSITKVTGVSFRTPKNYMLYKISKLCHYKSDIGNPNSATSDRITFHLCSYSKLVSPSIIYFTKIKPLKSYEKCFVSPKQFFWFLQYSNLFQLGSWKWNNYDIMKRITNLIFGKTQKSFWTKGTKMVMWRTTKEKNFWTYLAILKAVLDWVQKLK